MEKYRESARWPVLLSGFLFWSALMVAGPGHWPGPAFAGQPAIPAGKIIFEDKQARVKIIKTAAGVILKITTDSQGRVTVKELEHNPLPKATWINKPETQALASNLLNRMSYLH